MVKEVLQIHSKIVNRKGDNSRTPLERACNIGHKSFNQILMLMASSTSLFRTTECTGRLIVSEKISTACKTIKQKTLLPNKSMLPPHTESSASPHNLPASAGEYHPNFKTAMCRYGDRCIYGERCRYCRCSTLSQNTSC